MTKTWNSGELAAWLVTQTPATQEKALKDLSGDRRKRFIEWTTSASFYPAASLDIQPSSGRACDPPETDIYCELGGEPRYFELGQIVMPEVARNASIAVTSAVSRVKGP